MHAGPVIIGFDGTPASVGAVRESAALTGPRAALVVVVWEAGRNFELATLPDRGLEAPIVGLDLRTAFEAEEAAYEDARRMAEHGAALARQAGLQAEGLAVADTMTVADTLIRLACRNTRARCGARDTPGIPDEGRYAAQSASSGGRGTPD